MDIKKYIESNKKTDLIFDFDGTIALLDIDWENWHQGIAEIYKKYNTSFKYHGEYLYMRTNDFIEQYGSALRDEIVKFNYQYEKEFTKSLEPNKTLINFIKKEINHDMYVLTNNDSRNVKKHLTALGIIDKFKRIVCRDDLKYTKPSTEGIYEIIKHKNSISHFLMIGDSVDSDGAVAKEIGMDFFLVDYFK